MAKLTQERLKKLLYYFPDTGEFVWLSGQRSGCLAGTVHKQGYIYISIEKTRYRAGRLAWLYMTGKWPENEIDHKNGVPGDDRFCNLRDATRSENQRNVIYARGSGVRWVSWDSGRWVVRPRVGGMYWIRQYFETLLDAAARAISLQNRFLDEFSPEKRAK